MVEVVTIVVFALQTCDKRYIVEESAKRQQRVGAPENKLIMKCFSDKKISGKVFIGIVPEGTAVKEDSFLSSMEH